MQQKTRAKDGKTAADAGPYAYDLPVATGGGLPAPAPRPAPTKTGWSVEGMVGLIFLSVMMSGFADLSPLPELQTHAIIGAVTMSLLYWTRPKPRGGFWRWTLKSVGLFLNLYVGCVAVPASLLGLLPGPLAFGLPAFITLSLIFYYWVFASASDDDRRASPLWQWLLSAAVLAAFWAWLGPGAVK